MRYKIHIFMTLRHKGIACDSCLITNNQYWYAKVNYITGCDQYLISNEQTFWIWNFFSKKIQRHSVLHQKVLNSLLVQQTVYCLYSYIIFSFVILKQIFLIKSVHTRRKKLAAGKYKIIKYSVFYLHASFYVSILCLDRAIC